MYKIDESILNCNSEKLLTRLECIIAYLNHVSYSSTEIILAMLGIEKVPEQKEEKDDDLDS